MTKKDSVCRTYWTFIIRARWWFLHSHTLTQTASAGVPNYLPRGPTRFQWWFDHHISMMEKHQHAEPSTLQQGRRRKMTCTHWMCSLLHRKKTSQHCTAHKIYMCIYKVSTEWHVRNEEHSGTVGNVRIVKREITYNAFERVYLYIGYAMLSLH